MKPVLVTGANGFIGSHVVRALLRRGRSVRGLILPGTNRRYVENLAADWVEGDLLQPESLSSVLSGCETVYHLAAYNNLWSFRKDLPLLVNIGGTKNLLTEMNRAGVRQLIFTGTATLYRGQNGNPATEFDYVASAPQRNAYEESKFEAERLAFAASKEGLRVLSLAPTAPIGTGDVNLTAPGRLILDFLLGKLPIYLETGLNMVDVEALAEAEITAEERGRWGERYLVGGVNTQLTEVFQILARITDRPVPRLKIPYWVAMTVAHVSEWVSDWVTHRPPIAPVEGVRLARKPCFYSCQKAKKDLDLATTDLEKSLSKAVIWFRDHGFCS